MPASNHKETIPPCTIFVDKHGTWFHKGAPIIHQGFLDLFYQSLRRDSEGQYLVQFKNQVCRLDVEDTPFVVQHIDYIPRQKGGRDRVLLHLIDGSQEDLKPSTLFVGPENVLYCRIRNGVFRARFSRPGYYQITQYVEEDTLSQRFFLTLNDRKYFIEEKETVSMERQEQE